MSGGPMTLNIDQRAAVGAAFLKKLHRMKCTVFIVACGPTHLHVLFEPTEEDVMRQVGKAKQFASLKCPNHDGQLWGELSEVIAVRNDGHATEVFEYIDDHRNEGAWIWRCDQDSPPPS
jgi:REP element-mobilizing transposase RayT